MTTPIGIVGTGRVATSLAALLYARGLTIGAVAGRSSVRAAETAARAGNAPCITIGDLPALTSRVLVAVSDDALEEVASLLANSDVPPQLVLHTAGAAGPDALRSLRATGAAVGVMHPLQTVPSVEAGIRALDGCAFAYAGDVPAVEWACELIRLLNGDALAVDAQRWPFYHAAAVMACNYQAALMDAALELMEGAGVQQERALHALAPLVTQSVANIIAEGPEGALTGPIQRGDVGTVLRHVTALRQVKPDIQDLYATAGLRTVAVAARAGLPAAKVQELRSVLASASVQ